MSSPSCRQAREPDESFVLDAEDTIATVRAAHETAWSTSRRATATLSLDDSGG